MCRACGVAGHHQSTCSNPSTKVRWTNYKDDAIAWAKAFTTNLFDHWSFRNSIIVYSNLLPNSFCLWICRSFSSTVYCDRILKALPLWSHTRITLYCRRITGHSNRSSTPFINVINNAQCSSLCTTCATLGNCNSNHKLCRRFKYTTKRGRRKISSM